MNKNDYIPKDRCNGCPLFNYAGEKSFCRFDFQQLRSIGEGTSGGIYVPSEKCRVKKVRIYYSDLECVTGEDGSYDG